MDIDPREYQTSEPIALRPAQRDALGSWVAVAPALGGAGEGLYLLAPGSWVGALERIKDLTLQVRHLRDAGRLGSPLATAPLAAGA